MRRYLIILAAVLALPAAAQTVAQPDELPAVAVQAVNGDAPAMRFGYLSYGDALRAMPDYAVASRQIEELRAKYAAENRRVEDEFNSKYEEFLEGLKDFPQTILQKRQSELQEMMNRNIAFKEESRRLLEGAERDAFAPLHARLAAILRTIGEERGLAFIINTDGNACPFISPALGEDLNEAVRERF
ncbi:MAG: OmpH family outer membrane protein [Prevotella sp.]|nr:OmpH family outer membrane protein [Prevotella sp.]